MLTIDLHYQSDPPFGPNTHEERGIGGTENFITYTAEYLARAGARVRVYNRRSEPLEHTYESRGPWAVAEWLPLGLFDPSEPRDVLISYRFRQVFTRLQGAPNARLRVLMLADTESHGLGADVRAGYIDMVGFVSGWQRDKIAREEGLPPQACYTTSNGVNMELWDQDRDKHERIRGKCVHMATPERGLTYLLDIWPDIQKRLPWVSLHLFSSFKGWGVGDTDNLSMAGEIYRKAQGLIDQGASIVNHQHANAAEIRRHLLEAEAYLYPTRHFDETCCISAIEAAAAGVPIVATARGALNERVIQGRTGYLVQDIEGHDRLFTAMAIRALANPAVWRMLSKKAIKYARAYHYEEIISEWLNEFGRRLGA